MLPSVSARCARPPARVASGRSLEGPTHPLHCPPHQLVQVLALLSDVRARAGSGGHPPPTAGARGFSTNVGTATLSSHLTAPLGPWPQAPPLSGWGCALTVGPAPPEHPQGSGQAPGQEKGCSSKPLNPHPPAQQPLGGPNSTQTQQAGGLSRGGWPHLGSGGRGLVASPPPRSRESPRQTSPALSTRRTGVGVRTGRGAGTEAGSRCLRHGRGAQAKPPESRALSVHSGERALNTQKPPGFQGTSEKPPEEVLLTTEI